MVKTIKKNTLKTNKSKHKKLYKMKGCFKKNKTHKSNSLIFSSNKCSKCINKCNKKTCKCKCHYSKTMKGGGCGCMGKQTGGDALKLSLAYNGQPSTSYPNPYLAYTGKGGTHDLGKAYPDITGKSGTALNFINSGQQTRGGNNFNASDVNTASYPNGLIGPPLLPGNSHTWPGVSNINNVSNYYDKNIYQPNDVSRQMINSGSAQPFSVGGKKHRKKISGGGLIPDNLINLGNMFKYGSESVYNTINGYQTPVNPLPWKDQLTNTPNLNRE
jgi:hypothetical protein